MPAFIACISACLVATHRMREKRVCREQIGAAEWVEHRQRVHDLRERRPREVAKHAKTLAQRLKQRRRREL